MAGSGHAEDDGLRPHTASSAPEDSHSACSENAPAVSATDHFAPAAKDTAAAGSDNAHPVSATDPSAGTNRNSIDADYL